MSVTTVSPAVSTGSHSSSPIFQDNDQELEIEVSDESSGNSNTTAHKFLKQGITWVDLLAGIVGIVLLCIGVGVGLALYFVFKNNEFKNATFTLKTEAKQNVDRLQNVIEDSIISVRILTSFGLYHDGGIRMATANNPFIDGSGAVQANDFEAINYMKIVSFEERNSFETEMKSLGGIYSDFQISNTVNGTSVSTGVGLVREETKRPFYAPLIGLYPQVPLLGWDLMSDSERSMLVNKTIVTGNATLSNVILSKRSNVNTVQYYAPLVKNGKTLGVYYAVILIGDAIKKSLRFLSNINVIILEQSSFDKQMYKEAFVGSSVSESESQSLFGRPVSNLTYVEYLYLYQNSAIVTGFNVTVVDKVWCVYFMSTRSFLDSHSIYTKDLALVLCILGSLTLAILNSLVTKRIQYSYFTAKLNKMKLNSLLQSHKKTNVLLQKIGLRESKSRATIDAIPDIIFTIDSNGDIVQTNATFDKVVKLSAQDLEKRVPFKTILCNLDDSFLTKDDSIELVDTVVSIPQDGSTIKVQATVRNLHQREGQEESHVVVCKINEEQEELLRNLSVFEKTSKLRLRFVDLEVTLRDKNYKGQLVAFCASIKDPVKSTRALRLIKFIEAVESYKKHTFDQRIVDQEILYKKFFPLNGAIITDTNLLSLLSVMVTKSKGDMNIYDDVCDVVKLEFLNDYFVSFAPRTNSSNSDSEGFTVDETVLDTNASINTATSDHF